MEIKRRHLYICLGIAAAVIEVLGVICLILTRRKRYHTLSKDGREGCP